MVSQTEYYEAQQILATAGRHQLSPGQKGQEEGVVQPEQEGSLVSWALNLQFDRQGRWGKGFLSEARTNMGPVTARNVIVGRIRGG